MFDSKIIHKHISDQLKGFSNDKVKIEFSLFPIPEFEEWSKSAVSSAL